MDEDEIKDNIEVKIEEKKEVKKIVEMESGVYHDGDKYLYKADEQFESCCMKCDKELVLYIGKMGISVSVLLFSFYMLQDPSNDVAYYTSTLSLLLGHFLNNPIMKDKKDNNAKDKKE